MPALRPAAVLALLTFAAAAAAQPSWTLLEDSPTYSYRTEDLWFVDAEWGWGVGGDGRVHRTTDGGETWQHTATLPQYLRSTAFVSRDRGWVGTVRAQGAWGKLYKTFDGGLTFTDISDRLDPSVRGICSLFTVDEQVVYGAGTYHGPAHLVKTVDAGRTWTTVPLAPYLDTAIDVHFFDAQRGLVVGGVAEGESGDRRPRVIETTDGGATWTVRHTADVTPAWGWKLSFPTPSVGYMSIEKYDGDPTSRVLKTVDGGRTWEELLLPDAGGNMQGVGFLTPEVGWVSGRGVTSQTLDGGATWTQLPPDGPLDTNINRFVFLDDGLGFAAGRRLYRLDARATAAEAGPETGGLRSLAPNPARGAVRIRYAPSAPHAAVIDVFDALGRRVDRLEDAPGDGAATWTVPSGLAPGVYTVRLTTPTGAWARPVAVVR